MKKQLVIVACGLIVIFLSSHIVYAEDIVLADGCTLADAIAAANNDAAVGACPAGDGADTIRLTGDIVLQAALPFIDSDITIAGAGYTIDGAGKHHLFVISIYGYLRIHQLNVFNCLGEQGFSTITGLYRVYITIDDSTFRGNSSSDKGGVINASQGTIIIRNSIFENNSAKFAGVIFNEGTSLRPSEVYGTIEISNVTFENNQAYSAGVIGIFDGKLRIEDSSFTGNVAYGEGGNGGAIVNTFGNINIKSSSFTDNEAARGGAIHSLDGEVSVSDTTFANNQAIDGSAIYAYAVPSLTLRHVSMVNNVAEEDGAILSKGDPEFAGILHLHNSIVAGNIGGDCVAAAHENISSWVGDGSCGGALEGDPMFGEMVAGADDFTAYVPPLQNSPLIDSADPKYCTETVQLGVARPQGMTCDIGAIEFAPPADDA
ncbi:MAG: hypothetical protein OXG85_06610 [Chloroflexi bacterium]|nr:hypothetical protein [Chloroflexota bacterium]